LRWFDPDEADRLLLLNLGSELPLEPAPEPLLAAPRDAQWVLLWSSEDPRWGGSGIANPALPNGRWRLPAESAVLLHACRETLPAMAS
jgi:maltooligosyltrehalose trehalohydrolase